MRSEWRHLEKKRGERDNPHITKFAAKERDDPKDPGSFKQLNQK
jgi:hypothetical protein